MYNLLTIILELMLKYDLTYEVLKIYANYSLKQHFNNKFIERITELIFLYYHKQDRNYLSNEMLQLE